MPNLRQKRYLYRENARRRGGGIALPLLYDDFESGTVTPPTREANIGEWTVTDSNAHLSIAGGQLLIDAVREAQGDPGIFSPLLERVAGRSLITNFQSDGGGYHAPVAWDNDGVNWTFALYQITIPSDPGYITDVGIDLFVAAEDHQAVAMLLDTGCLFFWDGKLTWWDKTSSITPLLAGLTVRQTAGNAPSYYNATIQDLSVPSPLLDTAAPVNDNVYDLGVADWFLDLGITAPSTVAGAGFAGVRWRYGDANNYHFAGFEDDNFVAFSFEAGVRTEYDTTIDIEAIIADDATLTLRIVCTGSRLTFFTNNVKRGGTGGNPSATDSFNVAETVIAPHLSANWLSGGGSMADLVVWKRSGYSELPAPTTD